MSKYAAFVLTLIVFSSCHQVPTERMEVANFEDIQYSLCDAKQAQFSLVADFKVKGVIKKQETYHFPRIITAEEHYLPAMLGCCADGGGSYVLSYGLSEITTNGVKFRASCSYTVDAKQGKAEQEVAAPWFTPANEDNDEISINVKWIKKEPNQTMERIQ